MANSAAAWESLIRAGETSDASVEDAGGMTPSGSLVNFDPVGFGPLQVASIPAVGVVSALAFLLALSLAVRVARRRGVPSLIVVETHVAAVPAAILGYRLESVVSAWARTGGDRTAVALALAGPGNTTLAAVGVAVILAIMTWASSRPAADLLDVHATGAALMGAVALAAPLLVGPAPGALIGITCGCLTALAGMVLAHAAARAGAIRGEATVVSAEALTLGTGLRLLLANPAATAAMEATALLGCAMILGLLHLALRTARARAVRN